MVDFFKHMSPEAQARHESRRKNFEKDVAEFKEMPSEQLVERVQYFMKNCEFPGRYQPGEPVYDGVIAHVIIPELLRRVADLELELKALRNIHDKGNSFDLCLLVWFVARGATGAGQFPNEPGRGHQDREEFEHFFRDPHGYYKTLETKK